MKEEIMEKQERKEINKFSHIRANKKMVSAMHRAIKEYSMLGEGDKVAVGISGGKDSLTLLLCLAQYRKQVKFDFQIVAIAVDVFGNTDFSQIEDFCASLGVEFFVERTSIKEIVFDIRKEKNPCSLCANLRRGVLNSKAKALGCNKIALGHHADDFIETFFMCIKSENRLSTFWPKTYLSRLDLWVIRPFLYIWENDITAQCEGLPIVKSCCPANEKTEREKVKGILLNLNQQLPNFKRNLHASLCRVERYNLFDKVVKNGEDGRLE